VHFTRGSQSAPHPTFGEKEPDQCKILNLLCCFTPSRRTYQV